MLDLRSGSSTHTPICLDCGYRMRRQIFWFDLQFLWWLGVYVLALMAMGIFNCFVSATDGCSFLNKVFVYGGSCHREVKLLLGFSIFVWD